MSRGEGGVHRADSFNEIDVFSQGLSEDLTPNFKRVSGNSEDKLPLLFIHNFVAEAPGKNPPPPSPAYWRRGTAPGRGLGGRLGGLQGKCAREVSR